MTLRGRLTLFYTALLAVLLTVVAVATLALMRNNLLLGIDRDLLDTYRQFTRLFSQLDLTPPTESGENLGGGVPLQLSTARYLFPNAAIQIEELPFYDAETLAQALAEAKTDAQRRQLFASLRRLGDSTRRPLIGLDPNAPIRLTDEEFARLIRSPEQRLTITRLVKEPYGDVTPMRVLVTLGSVQQDSGVLGFPRESFALTYVGRNLSTLNYTLSQLQRVILVLFLVGLITAGVGAYLLAGQALRPLRQVQRAAEGIGGQNLGERVPEPRTGDEVQALAHALNAMLGRLEASFEAQRRFTSDASHELRTPVTAISGHASYLLRRTDPTEQQRESLNIIRRESERLTNLIASLLQLARSDSGALALTHQPILSGLFLAEIARELMPLAHAQGTELVARGEDVAFEGDPDRLKQVIINLVGNALKAGSRHITLISQPAEHGQEVRLSVQDDGPGIPPEHLARLFDRFYRVEDSRSRDQGGAGLGLSIAKGIMDAHGGRIWLESEVGRGTTAHVQLPVGNIPVLDEEDVP
ncbi:HAMP domain-containing protein [Deinococcus metallilatus]|uniref:histidine kinase n=1 Tax=Deinococcus metallilatus TaxID=1211322 RepID=A0AAJ5F5M9_9DEIO|nr:ATP-binding protein [Deinococcus metallilatus]MBB5297133.1 signal transduction histidine kinase [Deinococcus metallilatus]QBY10080.1 HAMP domain-containing protein [Deinococcus metallilatus]RXJ08335.1 HAMP domain-containing protein [Deinococcus metallilatus]TLK21955.1 HAMP domain-containing protein [Deinococcus metallilatus]GMA17302.1 two-component sensor histidine kinase [Deinococcus metallilatus]